MGILKKGLVVFLSFMVLFELNYSKGLQQEEKIGDIPEKVVPKIYVEDDQQAGELHIKGYVETYSYKYTRLVESLKRKKVLFDTLGGKIGMGAVAGLSLLVGSSQEKNGAAVSITGCSLAVLGGFFISVGGDDNAAIAKTSWRKTNDMAILARKSLNNTEIKVYVDEKHKNKFKLDEKKVLLNEKGEAYVKYSKPFFIISNKDDLWGHSFFDNLPNQEIVIHCENTQYKIDQIVKLGPFKDISSKIDEYIAYEYKHNPQKAKPMILEQARNGNLGACEKLVKYDEYSAPEFTGIVRNYRAKYDKLMDSSLFASKGEFENSEMYNKRLREANEAKQALIAGFRIDVNNEINNMLLTNARKIEESLKKIDLKVAEVGTYDAENELMPVTIGRETKKIRIPISEAKSFKSNAERIKVTALKQLNDDYRTYSVFNYEIIHPVTGSVYPFGPQRDVAIVSRDVRKKTSLPPQIAVRARLADRNGNKILDAGEKSVLEVTLENTGKGTAFDVVVNASQEQSDPNIYFARSRLAGDIQPGETKSIEMEIEANDYIEAKEHAFLIKAKEANGFDANPIRLVFNSLPMQYADLKIVDYGIESMDGENSIKPGVVTTVKTRIQNLGQGDAQDVKFDIKLPRNVFYAQNSQEEFNFVTIKSGEFKDVEFQIYTNNRVEDKIQIVLDSYEAKKQSELALNLEINKPLQTIQEFVQKGELQKKDIQVASGLTAEIAKNIPQTEEANGDAIAVIIGNKDYQRTKPVSYAMNDAELMKEYVIKAFGFKPGNVFVVKNASKSDFESLFGVKGNYKGKVYNAVKEDVSDLFIFYSGHGAPDIKSQKGYLMPVEADPQYVDLNGYSLELMYENVAQIPAKTVTIVMDACFSGADLLENVSPMVVKVDNPVEILNKGVILTSSRDDQVSSWYNEKRHGLFTYFFLKAIHDKNADRNGDNALTVKEVYDFIADKTEGIPYYARRIHGVEQDPFMQTSDVNRILVAF